MHTGSWFTYVKIEVVPEITVFVAGVTLQGHGIREGQVHECDAVLAGNVEARAESILHF